MMETHNCWWKERVFYEIYPRSFQDSNGMESEICVVLSPAWTISSGLG